MLASCVQEQLVGTNGSFATTYGDDAISMRTFVGNSTKGSVAGIDALQTNGFLVYAQHDQSGTSGTTGNTGANVPGTGSWNIMNKKYVTWNADAAKLYWEYSPIEYWPFGGTVDFYAYSIPGSKTTNAAGTEITDSAYDSEVTMDTDGIVLFSTRVALDEQIDLLAGAAIDCTKETSYLTNGVSFNFQHVLSRVGFRAKVQDDFDVDNYDIVVNSLEVFYNTNDSATTPFLQTASFDVTETWENVSSVGTKRAALWETPTSDASSGVAFAHTNAVVYDINTTGILLMNDTTGEVPYTRLAEEAGVTTSMVSAGYPFVINEDSDGDKEIAKEDVTLSEYDTRVALTAPNGYMMVIPQDYSSATYTDADAVTGVVTDNMDASIYVQVIFTAVKKGQAYDDADANGTWKKMTYVKNVALPRVMQTMDGTDIPHGFNPGKTYTFELELGLDAIVFSTQIGVDEWTPATGENSEAGEDGFHVEEDKNDTPEYGAGDPVKVGALTNAMNAVSGSMALDVATGTGTITLTWAAYAPDGDEVNTGFRVEYTGGTGSHSFTHAVTVDDADATGVEIKGVDSTLDYSIAVVAVGAPGQYGYSAAATTSVSAL